MNWIKPSQRLPEDDDKVLIMLKKDYKQLTGYYLKEYENEKEGLNKPWRVYSCGCCYPYAYRTKDILYWMPLPEKPKD